VFARVALSGHEQSVFMSFEDSGKSDIPAALKASSIFWASRCQQLCSEYGFLRHRFGDRAQASA